MDPNLLRKLLTEKLQIPSDTLDVNDPNNYGGWGTWSQNNPNGTFEEFLRLINLPTDDPSAIHGGTGKPYEKKVTFLDSQIYPQLPNVMPVMPNDPGIFPSDVLDRPPIYWTGTPPTPEELAQRSTYVQSFKPSLNPGGQTMPVQAVGSQNPQSWRQWASPTETSVAKSYDYSSSAGLSAMDNASQYTPKNYANRASQYNSAGSPSLTQNYSNGQFLGKNRRSYLSGYRY